jgi:beta-lactamase regulating signal transducer with metallopeptidase domain
MNELYQSPILYSLGWAIAGSFWQMGLLWLVYQVVAGIPFRQKPGIKHGASVIFMGIGSLWFMVSFFQRLYSVREVQTYINRVDLNSDQFIANKSGSFTAMIEEAEKFLPYFSTAYLIILMILLFRLAQGLVLTYQISSTKNIRHAPQWQHYVDRLCVQLNIGREVLIYLSETINVPATVGFIKPIILLPVATVNQLSITQAEAIYSA